MASAEQLQTARMHPIAARRCCPSAGPPVRLRRVRIRVVGGTRPCDERRRAPRSRLVAAPGQRLRRRSASCVAVLARAGGAPRRRSCSVTARRRTMPLHAVPGRPDGLRAGVVVLGTGDRGAAAGRTSAPTAMLRWMRPGARQRHRSTAPMHGELLLAERCAIGYTDGLRPRSLRTPARTPSVRRRPTASGSASRSTAPPSPPRRCARPADRRRAPPCAHRRADGRRPIRRQGSSRPTWPPRALGARRRHHRATPPRRSAGLPRSVRRRRPAHRGRCPRHRTASSATSCSTRAAVS